MFSRYRQFFHFLGVDLVNVNVMCCVDNDNNIMMIQHFSVCDVYNKCLVKVLCYILLILQNFSKFYFCNL